MSTIQKGAILRKCLNTFVPHCSYILVISQTEIVRRSRFIDQQFDNNDGVMASKGFTMGFLALTT